MFHPLENSDRQFMLENTNSYSDIGVNVLNVDY